MPFFSKSSQSTRDSAPTQSSLSMLSLLRKDAPSTSTGVAQDSARIASTVPPAHKHPSSKSSSQAPITSTVGPQSPASLSSRGASYKTQYRAKDFGAAENKYGALAYGGLGSSI